MSQKVKASEYMCNQNKPDLSVVIITLNEERHIESCIDSLPVGCEVIVVDSNSQDQTKLLAEKKGAIVIQRDFDDFATQKNFALKQATQRWVLSLDADEILSSQLCEEIASIARGPSQDVSGYRIKRNLIFMQKRLRFGKSQDRPLRLFLRGRGAFTHTIHEKVEVSGHIKQIRSRIEHYSYDDLDDYFARFNRYTGEIAKQHFRKNTSGPSLFFHVLRPWGDFFIRYFVRLGFLDGYPGYSYALFSSVYGFVKYAKLREFRSKAPREVDR